MNKKTYNWAEIAKKVNEWLFKQQGFEYKFKTAELEEKLISFGFPKGRYYFKALVENNILDKTITGYNQVTYAFKKRVDKTGAVEPIYHGILKNIMEAAAYKNSSAKKDYRLKHEQKMAKKANPQEQMTTAFAILATIDDQDLVFDQMSKILKRTGRYRVQKQKISWEEVN